MKQSEIQIRLSLKYLLFALFTLTLCSGGSAAEISFHSEVLTDDLEHPWGLAFLPDQRILITERTGRLRIFADGVLVAAPVAGLPPIRQRGQGGLMGVVLHPEFVENQFIYLSYSGSGTGGHSTEVLRGKFEGKELKEIKIIFRARPKVGGGRHFGGRLLFDDAGYLFVSLGDRGQQDDAQNLSSHSGSLVRLHDDGTIPKDNPFGTVKGVASGVYTLGNRNMQGMVLHPHSRIVWTHEHGPQGGDEINIMQAGENYGWPVITYGVNYGIGTKIGEGTQKIGMVQPIYKWVPSIAPSGMAFYSGDKFPQWRGDLFVGSLKFGLLVHLRVRDNEIVGEERLIAGEHGRIRDVVEGPDGYLYLLTEARKGKLVRLVP